ncbi:phosphate uptake regulator PhoU [Candidatus Woesearchaeota archaeon]|nr:phosphate uptake regulator PhoU [Candidatus Woesearchaeota archaeon]
MRRKAIRLANNTLVVSLPASWVKKVGISKGDEIDVSESEGRLVLSRDGAAATGNAEVDVSGMDPMIKRILGALYKSGYDEVKVRFSTIAELKTVQEVVREEFLGFEVVDQKKGWLVFRKVSHIEPKEFNTMLRRMFLIIISMAEDSLEAVKKGDGEWLEAISLHDKDVNKIADFCRRILNTTGAEGYRRMPPAYFMVEQLEKIGDLYRDICRGHSGRSPKISAECQRLYDKTNRFLRCFYEVMFDFDLGRLRDFAESRYRLREAFTKAFAGHRPGDVMTLVLLNSVVESAFDMNGPLMASKL